MRTVVPLRDPAVEAGRALRFLFDLPGSTGNQVSPSPGLVPMKPLLPGLSYGLSRENGGLFGLQTLSDSAPAELMPSHDSQPNPPGASLPSVRS